MRILRIAILLSLLPPCMVLAQEPLRSQFIGSWCSNPCLSGTVSRPWNLPCGFEITEDEIRWKHHTQLDRKSEQSIFVLKYVLVEKIGKREVFLVFGGDKDEWYAYGPASTAKHKLTFTADHSNQYAANSVELKYQPYCEEPDKCYEDMGMFFITKSTGSCHP